MYRGKEHFKFWQYIMKGFVDEYDVFPNHREAEEIDLSIEPQF